MKLIRYIFFRIYTWQYNLYGEENIPHYTATLLISIIIFISLSDIILLLNVVLNEYIIDYYSLSKTQIGLYTILLIIINSYMFLYNSRYKKILQEFIEDEYDDKLTFSMWIWIIGASAGFFLLSLMSSSIPK